MWDYRAQLLKLDPDSPMFLIDQGLNSRQEVSVRLKGVFAPERWQPGYTECLTYLDGRLKGLVDPLLKWPFYVVTEKTEVVEPKEKLTFTRYIGDVWIIGTDPLNYQWISVNQIMIDFLALHSEYPGGIGSKT